MGECPRRSAVRQFWILALAGSGVGAEGSGLVKGADHQYFNMTGEKVEIVFGVAPDF